MWIWWEIKRTLTSFAIMASIVLPLLILQYFSARADYWRHVAPRRPSMAKSELWMGRITALIVFLIINVLIAKFGVIADE